MCPKEPEIQPVGSETLASTSSSHITTSIETQPGDDVVETLQSINDSSGQHQNVTVHENCTPIISRKAMLARREGENLPTHCIVKCRELIDTDIVFSCSKLF